MLTGDIGVTKGDAYINQHSVVGNILAARQSMGYCPQFDALNDLLTAREHLNLYARIRGIQEEDVNQVCTRLRIIIIIHYVIHYLAHSDYIKYYAYYIFPTYYLQTRLFIFTTIACFFV
jgi:ABC-type Na+ transport system ATPase subunit NatA